MIHNIEQVLVFLQDLKIIEKVKKIYQNNGDNIFRMGISFHEIVFEKVLNDLSEIRLSENMNTIWSLWNVRK